MTTFSIASILGDQNRKLIEQQQQQQDADDNDRDQEGNDDEEEEEGEDTTSSIEEQKQFVFNNNVQHLYDVLYKNAVMAARFNEQHHHKTNLMRSFPSGTPSTSSNDFYSLHKLNTSSYQGKIC